MILNYFYGPRNKRKPQPLTKWQKIKKFFGLLKTNEKYTPNQKDLEDIKLVMKYLSNGYTAGVKAPANIQEAYSRQMGKLGAKVLEEPTEEQKAEIIKNRDSVNYDDPLKEIRKRMQKYLPTPTENGGPEVEPIRPEFMLRVVNEVKSLTKRTMDDDKMLNRKRGEELVRVWRFYGDIMEDYLSKVSPEELDENINVLPYGEKYNPHAKLKADKDKRWDVPPTKPLG